MRHCRTLARGRVAATLVVAFALGACGQENPTDVGGPLLPGGVTTFTVTLDADRFLLSDSAFTGYTRPQEAPFFVIAEDFQGAFDAHAVARLFMPRTITVFDASGLSRVDSMPRFFGGYLTLRVDTLRWTAPAQAVEFSLYRLAEDFDQTTVTWTNRVDSTGVTIPWMEPGGTAGVHVADAIWDPGTDSLVFEVDSATVVAWADTTMFAGALIAMSTPGTRFRATDLFIELDARSTIQPDTIVRSVVRPLAQAFVYDPLLAGPSATPRIGGNPAWRTYLRLVSRLDTLTVPCPDVPAGCRLQLSETTVNLANLVFEPIAAPPGFLPEDSMLIGAREALVTNNLPIQRAPLGSAAGLFRGAVEPGRFNGDDQVPVEVSITDYFRALVADTVPRRPEPYLGLVTPLEGQHVGVASFASMPRLRLVITIPRDLENR